MIDAFGNVVCITVAILSRPWCYFTMKISQWFRWYGSVMTKFDNFPLQWRHNWSDGVSNHQPHHFLLSRLFGGRSKKTSKLRVTGLCAGNSPGTGTNGQLRGKCFHLMTSSCYGVTWPNWVYRIVSQINYTAVCSFLKTRFLLNISNHRNKPSSDSASQQTEETYIQTADLICRS